MAMGCLHGGVHRTNISLKCYLSYVGKTIEGIDISLTLIIS